MGLGKTFKKIGKVLENTVKNPVSLLVPVAIPGVLAKETVDEIARQKEEKAYEKEVNRQNQINAANQNFSDNLEEKRTKNYKSKVIFAGILGDNNSVGLGGTNSLLGL